ncbi:hypothetical protein AB0G82_20725 [Streptomyces anulatus]|uniref:hypothetical protein n=1 Tax=Streptomyces anulatus TaxID=1892 RepID=UPI0033E24321
MLLTALREGRVDEKAAREAGLTLPYGYLVLALAIGPHADEHAPGVDTNAVAQRKLRRLCTELALHTRGTALTSLTINDGLVLLPIDTSPAERIPAHWDDTTQLLTREGRGRHLRHGRGVAGSIRRPEDPLTPEEIDLRERLQSQPHPNAAIRS